ncbi:hypothetical protein ACIQPR_18330 [Streptomyces sp. NPDC091280]|uniref:hypothetical protein n=1 Tax=Streptomyces sp. NPDC091280 TaxID=3365984 RepID=UPI003817B2A4
MAGWAPVEQLFGLHVDFGHCTRDGRWLRPPAVRFTCLYGCDWATSGALRVAHFTRVITSHHALHCPGPPLT